MVEAMRKKDKDTSKKRFKIKQLNNCIQKT